MLLLRTAQKCTVAVAITLALLTAMADAKSNLKRVCQDHSHQGVGESVREDVAKDLARQAWKTIVTTHDGSSWAKLPPSGPVHCVPHQNQAHCWIEATPCRMVPIELPAARVKPNSVPAPVN